MATNVGTNDNSTLLAARFQSAKAFGLNTIREVLQADLDAHNTIVNQMVGDLCELTTDAQRIYGTSSEGEMVEVDEYGKAAGQRVLPGATVGFPLKLFQYNVGWTNKWLETHTPAEMAARQLAAQKAHLRRIQKELKSAMYLSANYTFNDHLVDKIDLGVKRFVNADSAAIPDGPNGETFAGASHTHYTAASSLAVADITAAIDTVIEHGHGNKVILAINKTNEAAVRALTGFTAYIDPRLIVPGGATSGVPNARLDVSRLDNRAIGLLGGAEVWVKPWAIAGYAVVYDSGSPMKPLAYRQRTQTTLQGLRIASELDDYPLQTQFMEAEFGVGVWTRTNGAVHDFGHASYTDPTIS